MARTNKPRRHNHLLAMRIPKSLLAQIDRGWLVSAAADLQAEKRPCLSRSSYLRRLIRRGGAEDLAVDRGSQSA